MNDHPSQRGRTWLDALTDKAAPVDGYPASVRVVDAPLAGHSARYIAVVPDPDSAFVRARAGEVGLEQGWAIAQAVREVCAADRDSEDKRPIVAVIDVPSQAYGRSEEAFGIHQALAAAVEAYAQARAAGHPVIGLIVGKAMSGAFLAHGYQANRLIALDDDGVEVHAMGKQAAARVTQRTVEGVETLAKTITPMAYDIRSFDSLGLLYRLFRVENAQAPAPVDIESARTALADALADIADTRDLGSRLNPGRQASVEVRKRLRAQW
ncbi:malonate decarboxylase subunit gamma [Salinisphaera dokdonensis CL-ES53]|uniref:Malonate decarboxylase subunit gamma n=1 Tax=Salinisphaera dokdonensis CL-ES53 TaxID=1304272 RepID=A0ABV2B5A3_9GAMM